MNAYLIDPTAMTVTQVEYNGDFKVIYTLIDADAFDCARFNREGDAVFVDDEGLINGKEQNFFKINGYPTPLAGKGLVLGCDMNTGESISPSVTLQWLRDNVMFGFPMQLGSGIAFVSVGKHQEVPNE
jgi:hypothetical protein